MSDADEHPAPEPPSHTRASTDFDSDPDYCRECSEAAQEWVSWPCSPAKVVRAYDSRQRWDEPTTDVTEDEVARVIWEASYDGEGAVSAIGAVHAARAVLAAFHVTRRTE